MFKQLKRRINGATFEQLLGIMGDVTRKDAKALARLHGHPWPKVLRELHRRARAGYYVTPTEAPSGPQTQA